MNSGKGNSISWLKTAFREIYSLILKALNAISNIELDVKITHTHIFIPYEIMLWHLDAEKVQVQYDLSLKWLSNMQVHFLKRYIII